jgi:YHS domain-containing protein
MAEDPREKEEKLACHVCRAEIPKAAALHAEGREYAYHFCSAGCLAEWEKKQDTEEDGKG